MAAAILMVENVFGFGGKCPLAFMLASLLATVDPTFLRGQLFKINHPSVAKARLIVSSNV